MANSANTSLQMNLAYDAARLGRKYNGLFLVASNGTPRNTQALADSIVADVERSIQSRIAASGVDYSAAPANIVYIHPEVETPVVIARRLFRGLMGSLARIA